MQVEETEKYSPEDFEHDDRQTADRRRQCLASPSLPTWLCWFARGDQPESVLDPEKASSRNGREGIADDGEPISNPENLETPSCDPMGTTLPLEQRTNHNENAGII